MSTMIEIGKVVLLLDRIAGAPGLAADKATRWRERAAWLRAHAS